MDYKEAWGDLKKWLDSGIDYISLQMEIQLDSYGTETAEYKKLKSKRSGFEVTKRQMLHIEKALESTEDHNQANLSITCKRCGETSEFSKKDKDEGRFSKNMKILKHYGGVRFVCTNEDCQEQTVLM